MFAPTALLVGIYREMVALDWTDTPQSLIVVNAAFNLPFCVWILHAYFSSIPLELEEAAFLDGAGRFTAFTRVTLPWHFPGSSRRWSTRSSGPGTSTSSPSP